MNSIFNTTPKVNLFYPIKYKKHYNFIHILFLFFIIYFSFLSYIYLKKEVHAGISHVQSKIPLFYNIYCILLPDFKDIKKSHISGNQKRNCRLFSPLLQGQIRVPAPPVPQASPRAVSELTTSGKNIVFYFLHSSQNRNFYFVSVLLF